MNRSFPFRDLILKHLRSRWGYPNMEISSVNPLYGGSINSVYRLRLAPTGKTLIGKEFLTDLVVKTNTQKPAGFFAKEMSGLTYLYEVMEKHQIPIRIPKPLGVLSSVEPAPVQILIMEYIPPGKDYPRSHWSEFGENLARLHIETAVEREKLSMEKKYGWHENTFIGNSIQHNTLESDWVVFFKKHRLLPQREWGKPRLPSTVLSQLDRVIDSLDRYLPSTPPASLLHGDLWTGNFFFSTQGEPVIYDPAVYYGHGETDLAMTELFGSFPPDFYHGYHSRYPRDGGTDLRKVLYNLYHLLNHLNLFGSSYLSSVSTSLRIILR